MCSAIRRSGKCAIARRTSPSLSPSWSRRTITCHHRCRRPRPCVRACDRAGERQFETPTPMPPWITRGSSLSNVMIGSSGRATGSRKRPVGMSVAGRREQRRARHAAVGHVVNLWAAGGEAARVISHTAVGETPCPVVIRASPWLERVRVAHAGAGSASRWRLRHRSWSDAICATSTRRVPHRACRTAATSRRPHPVAAARSNSG